MAATYSSLEHIFKKPENPTLLLESLSSWKPIKNPTHDSSFTEIFGELHYKENPIHPHQEMVRDVNGCDNYNPVYTTKQSKSNQYGCGEGFSSMNSESLSICTEELGSESSGDVEEWYTSGGGSDKGSWEQEESRIRTMVSHCSVSTKRLRTSKREFPPPISCIGETGKPWVHFDTSRENGRFILKEIRIPTQEYLHVYRENGRLNMTVVYSESDDDIEEGEEEEEDFGSEENVEVGNRREVSHEECGSSFA